MKREGRPIQIQSSYKKNDKGILYIVPTPIGNLEDMTFRAVDTLKEANLILAEDTRHTQKLLNHFQIKNALLSFHDHNSLSRMAQVMERLLSGETLALVSDAGMPAISDPGYDLVKEAITEDIHVIVLPGANAALCALVGSGLPTNEFLFYGFLPRKNQEKVSELKRVSQLKATVIFYESPFRVKDTLRFIEKVVGNRSVVISREITKVYEQYIRGTSTEVSSWLEENDIKGECCIIMEGNTSEETATDHEWWNTLTLAEHVQHYEVQGKMTNKAAMKQVAKDRDIPKRDVYQVIHVEKET